jgi:hypothetical protein
MEEHKDVTTADLASIMWFLFDVIIKSMTLRLHYDGLLGSRDHGEWFSTDYARLLLKLITYLVKYYKTHVSADEYKPSMELNKIVALFVRDLYPLLDRGRVHALVRITFFLALAF